MIDKLMNGVYFLENHDFDANNRLRPLPEDKGKYGILLMFSYNCPHCSGIKPEYVELMKELKNAKVRFYAINGTGKNHEDFPSRASEMKLMTRAREIVKPFQFRGFPSVFLINPEGDVVAEFEEERTKQGLLKFLRDNKIDL